MTNPNLNPEEQITLNDGEILTDGQEAIDSVRPGQEADGHGPSDAPHRGGIDHGGDADGRDGGDADGRDGGDADGKDGGDADGTDGGDADGTDGDSRDGTDGDSGDADGTDGGDADGTDA